MMTEEGLDELLCNLELRSSHIEYIEDNQMSSGFLIDEEDDSYKHV